MQLTSISIYSSDAHKGVSTSLNWQAYGSLVCRGLEQEKQDLGRQVQTLLIQVQGGEAAEAVLRLTQGDDTGLVTSDDVISDRLLSFTDVQACTCLGGCNLLKACQGHLLSQLCADRLWGSHGTRGLAILRVPAELLVYLLRT